MKLPLDTNVRPEVEETLRQEDFRRLGAFPLLRVAMRAGVRCREVPKGRLHPATDLDRHPQMAVECRCGHRPVVDLGKLAKCECERWFLYAGTAVFSLAGPRE